MKSLWERWSRQATGKLAPYMFPTSQCQWRVYEREGVGRTVENLLLTCSPPHSANEEFMREMELAGHWKTCSLHVPHLTVAMKSLWERRSWQQSRKLAPYMFPTSQWQWRVYEREGVGRPVENLLLLQAVEYSLASPCQSTPPLRLRG